MKNQFRWFIIALLIIPMLLFGQDISDRQLHYRPGDWISYPVARTVTSVDVGNTYVFFGTTHGITRYDYYRSVWDTPFTWSDGLENDDIRIVLYDFNTGFLWCATRAGVSYRIPSAEEWRNNSYASLGSGPVLSLGSGKRYVWIEDRGGLFRSDPTVAMFWQATPQEETEDQVRWRGRRAENQTESLPDLFMDAGYFFFPEGYIQDMELRRFDISTALRDDFSHLWIGTRGLGAGVADMLVSRLALLPFGPFHSDIEAMAWDGGGMWMGGIFQPGKSGGVTWWNMDEEEWIYYEAEILPELWTDCVTSIAPDVRYVWFGTTDGLARYDKSRDRWRMFSVQDNLWSNQIHTVVLGKKTLWVGTELGINRIRLPSMVVEQVRVEALNHRRIYRLEADGDDVWAGTDRGIFRFNGKEEAWEFVPGDPSIVAQEITAISAWGDEVWFGTENGVMAYDKVKDAWQGFPPVHYPTAGPIHVMAADSGVVWAGTDNGVLKYIKKENRWLRFTTNDGLLDNRVRWILLDWDHIWFGTPRGLTRFYWNAPYRVD
jgi:ligand-binding sensor domain-containing protein